jgi:prepilin-type N-terminal cleavage/methylation domain-containing protein
VRELQKQDRRASVAGADGFTLIEVVAAMAIMAVVAAALAGVLWGSLRSAAISSTRSRAVAVATRETESIRSVPYDSIGFYADQAGYVATFGGATTVKLADLTPVGVTPKVSPAGTVLVGPNSFTVARYLTYASASDGSTTFTQAYKRTTVIVTWTDGGGPHSVRQDSIVYPGGRGPVPSSTTSTSTTVVSGPPNAPTMVTPTVPAAPAGEAEIDLAWAPGGGGAPTAFVLERATNNAFTVGVVSTPSQPASATAYQWTGLASGTTYYFRMRASNANGTSSYSNIVSGVTLSPAPAGCSVSSLSVTETDNPKSTVRTYLKSNGDMATNLSLAVSLSSTCGTTVFRVTGKIGAVPDPGSPFSLSGSAPSLSGAVGSKNQGGWSVGTHTFEVVDASGNSLTPPVTKTFLVCASGSTVGGCA